MPLKIIILEDNAEREAAMRQFLVDRFYQYDSRFFAVASEMIEFLRVHLSEALAISLDHDLELLPKGNGEFADPGTGRDVADYLAGCAAVCPVIIHTTNVPAAAGMELVLHDAGWETQRVVPYDDLNWIAEDWFPTLRRAIVGSVGGHATGPPESAPRR